MSKLSTSYRDELLESLKDNSEAAEYLQAALEDSLGAFLVALKNVLDARKVTAIARASNLSREHLYQMLREDGNPTLNSLDRILHALGLRLAIDLEAVPSTPKQSFEIPSIATCEEQSEYASWSDRWVASSSSTHHAPVYKAGLCDIDDIEVNVVSTSVKTASSASASRLAVPHPAFVSETEDCYEMAY
jgi:probable addiction module antidote protein